ncbi:MAG: hypothetical protein ACKVP7_04965 [Hyphomicrobiaceae bacterium]
MNHAVPLPDLTDPHWLPTDQEEIEFLEAAARRVAWEKAMAKQGIMVLTLGLTPEEEEARINIWARSSNLEPPQEIER